LAQGGERQAHRVERERGRPITNAKNKKSERTVANPIRIPSQKPPNSLPYLQEQEQESILGKKKKEAKKDQEKGTSIVVPQIHPITKLNPSSSNPYREQSKQDFFDLYSSFSCKDFVFLDCY